MEFKSQRSTSKPENLDTLDYQDGIVVDGADKSFEQEANDALALQGLKVVKELHYQAKLQSLINLTYERIPNVKDALFNLLADNAQGFSNGNLKQGVRFIVDKAASEAKRDLDSKKDVDLPVFDTSRPWTRSERFPVQKIVGMSGLYTLHEFDTAPGYSREPMSAQGVLAKAPLFYVGKLGMLCNNWHVTTKVYEDKFVYTTQHDFMPIIGNTSSDEYGMGQIFTGKFDREKLSHASIDVQILYYLWYIAANMVKAGAIMPQLLVDYEGNMQCRWIPATLSREIRDLVTKVGIFLQGYEHLFLHRTERSAPMDPLFFGQLMLSGFIQSYVCWAFFWHASDNYSQQPEYRVLFTLCSCWLNTDNIQHKALQMRLESWLSPLTMSQLSFTPVLRFYDLASEEIRHGSLFTDLSREIKRDAIRTQIYMHKAVNSLSSTAASIVDSAQDTIEQNWDLSDLASGRAEPLTSREQSLDKVYYESFDNTYGVGLELGFANLGDKITSDLYMRGLIDDSGFVPLALILRESCCKTVRYDCLRTASRLGAVAEILNELFKAPSNICVVPLDRLYDTLQIALNGLTLLGVRLILPRSLNRLLKPISRVQLDIEERENSRSTSFGFLDIGSMLNFTWHLAVGDRRLTANEFKVLLASSGKIVRFHDQFVYADPSALLKIQNHLKSQHKLQTNKMALLNAALTGTLDNNEVTLSPKLKEVLQKMTTPEPISEPENLNAVLRPYQKRGYEWLMHNIKVNIGSILADDMGLGKTLQVIAALLKLKQTGQIDANNQALIIVPTSLITNWSREIKHFAPELSAAAFYGVHSALKDLHTDIVITSYGTARSRISAFANLHYRLIVVDEAQAIKNRDTAVHRALHQLKADYYIAMSGTPVENHLIEYYSILDFANRGMFGTAESFRKNFAIPIEKERDMDTVKQFRNLTAPFIMRRLKSDKIIISDLPDKMTSNQYCSLTANQAALYQSTVEATMIKLDEVEKKEERSALVLRLVQRLKAICNSPAQYEKSEDHYKATDSGKVERLLELVDEILETDGKALIFTQSVIMGNYLVEILREHTGSAPQFLHGGISITERMQMVDRFQNDPTERFLLLSLRAAGTGLNLTAANFVIHFDLWWNPAVENQATDRAYRIGQQNKVQVYRFICANTFEERINEMLDKKRDLAELTVADGENWIGDLSNRQLKELFSLSDQS